MGGGRGEYSILSVRYHNRERDEKVLWAGGGCNHIMHDRGHKTIDPRMPTMPGRRTAHVRFSSTSQTHCTMREGGGLAGGEFSTRQIRATIIVCVFITIFSLQLNSSYEVSCLMHEGGLTTLASFGERAPLLKYHTNAGTYYGRNRPDVFYLVLYYVCEVL